jgi:hypothetical protein
MHQQEEIKKDGWLVEKVKKVRDIRGFGRAKVQELR